MAIAKHFKNNIVDAMRASFEELTKDEALKYVDFVFNTMIEYAKEGLSIHGKFGLFPKYIKGHKRCNPRTKQLFISKDSVGFSFKISPALKRSLNS
jgi:nucleoid DNA-binding protein